MEQSSELALLDEQFPEWEFRTRWVSAASGPDVKVYEARLNEVVVSASDTAELARKIREHEQP
jgi:hypothetical protein